jgi:phosphohistidine swiveling domain-containing protein
VLKTYGRVRKAVLAVNCWYRLVLFCECSQVESQVTSGARTDKEQILCYTVTPVFGIIAGAVTDGGDAMTHAAIVSREYGIPSVVRTIEATGKIKTGNRISVDGDNCAVYILDK